MGNFNANEYLSDPSGEPSAPIYFYSRESTCYIAEISEKNGLFAKQIAAADFPPQKNTQDTLIAFKKALGSLQPHERAGIIEPDTDTIFSEVDKQNLFMSLLIDRLNNPEGAVKPEPVTKFVMHERKAKSGALIFLQGKNKAYDALPIGQEIVPIFTLKMNNGLGNYLNFITFTCLPQDEVMFKSAISDTVYNYERALKHLKANRTPPGSQNDPNGITP